MGPQNIENIDLFKKGDEREMSEKVKDLVCGMEIDKDTAAATYEHKGKTYYFCNLGCRDKFAQDPEKYVAREEEG